LSVTRTYFGLAGGPARFTRNFTGSALLGNAPTPRLFLHLRDSHPLRRRFPTASAKRTINAPGRQTRNRHTPQPRERNDCRLSHARGLATSPFAHHYSGNHYCLLFLRVLRCFTSPRHHQPPYTFRRRQPDTTRARFPHSDTHGSKLG